MRSGPFISAVICLGISLALCSCSHSSTTPCDIDEQFTSQVTITQDGKEFSAELTRADADIWEMSFSKPDTVAGMKIGLTGGSCTLRFQGLSYQLDRNDLSPYSMVSIGCEAMEKLISKDDITCTADGGKLTEKGTVSGMEFTAVFEDDKIKELTVSDQLRFEF